MAKAQIDPATLYKVDLSKSVKIGRLVINPSNGARLRGDALAEIIQQDPDAVATYKAV